MASKSAEHLFSLNLFLEWISGFCGTTVYQEEISKIVRVIIAGGVFANHSNEATLNESDVIASADSVDAFSAALSAVAPVDLMPGCKDPSGIMLPQKPFHYCLFPKSVEYKSFNRVSNPYECEIGGFLCLGSSGEPIKDIMKYSKLDNELEIMRRTLQWRHLAPTCPDTVPCTPCIETDPFTIYNCPAIYFSGNCREFATDLHKGPQRGAADVRGTPRPFNQFEVATRGRSGDLLRRMWRMPSLLCSEGGHHRVMGGGVTSSPPPTRVEPLPRGSPSRVVDKLT
ncbi:DNA polymerase delta small subunit [Papilio machaon]|uniref:DNA polymerase delta small subunit n=1 Tax=Papilio machaon TaxID=76193 RepID=A0A0N1I6M9_PAPMA|nr:DNA polymerase delta small subunit [Papilio machaon]